MAILTHDFKRSGQLKKVVHTVFPHIRPAGIIILHSLQMRVLLENTTFLLHLASIVEGSGLQVSFIVFPPRGDKYKKKTCLLYGPSIQA